MNQELELELTFLAKELPKGIEAVKPTRIVDVLYSGYSRTFASEITPKRR